MSAIALPLEVEEFLTWLTVERGRSANTLAAYRRDLGAYCQWLTERGLTIERVGEAHITDYVGFLRRGDRAPASVARAVVAVRGLHRFLADEGHVDDDPSADVATPKVPQGLPKPLTEDEVETLLAAVIGLDAVARRDRAILELLYATGMRISELVGLSLGHVDAQRGVARVFGKGAKERLVPIGRHGRVALTAWLDEGRPDLVPARWARRHDADAVFLNQRGGRLSRQGAWAIVRQYGEATGLEDRLSPHVLRHSCATHMLDHGADIRIVGELLGHASISTTQLYTKVSSDKLREAYDAAHPRARLRAR